MKVFLTHTDEAFAGYYGDRPLAALSRIAEVRRNTTSKVLRGKELAQAAAGCQAIIADRSTPGEADTFIAEAGLLAFLRCAVDISTIDVPAASTQGVLVTRATPGFTDSVAELGLGMMIDLARGITRMAASFHQRKPPGTSRGMQLTESTLGLIGYGRIAQRLEELVRPMRMKTLVHDPILQTRSVPLEQLLSQADFTVCLAISNETTIGLMNSQRFQQMKAGSFFINLSRGQLVDEQALEDALDAEHLAGAALDVGMAADQMPSLGLASRSDVIATPHIGGLTQAATEHQAMDTVRQIEALVAGRIPDGAVNADEAYRLRREFKL